MRLCADTLLYTPCCKQTPWTVNRTGCETDLDGILCVITYSSVLNNEKNNPSKVPWCSQGQRKSATSSCFTKLEALMHSICLFGSIVLSSCLLVGPFCSGDYRIIIEIYIVKEEIGGQVWCLKAPPDSDHRTNDLLVSQQLAHGLTPPQVDQNIVFSFYLLCEEIQTIFFLFFFPFFNNSPREQHACKRTSNRGSRALTCGLPPAVDNWPQKIWARTVCLDGADLSHNFQWGGCHRETEHGTPIILASYSTTHLLGSSVAVGLNCCWDQFGRFNIRCCRDWDKYPLPLSGITTRPVWGLVKTRDITHKSHTREQKCDLK